jgi:hypothetical protein
VYNLLLDQAWRNESMDSVQYVIDWIERRYGPGNTTPEILQAWDILRQTVYNNTYLTGVNSVVKSIFVPSPFLPIHPFRPSRCSSPLHDLLFGGILTAGTPTLNNGPNKSDRPPRHNALLQPSPTNKSLLPPPQSNSPPSVPIRYPDFPQRYSRYNTSSFRQCIHYPLRGTDFLVAGGECNCRADWGIEIN